MYCYTYPIRSDELFHHGILKQKWGVRNGPPYPLSGGDYSPAEKKAIYTERSKKRNSIYNKKHFDETLKKGTEISTLSWNKDRTKGADFFYGTHDNVDKHFYKAFFNKPIKEEGKKLLKYKINNKAVKNIDVASEDSQMEVFKELYTKDRDFYNFVTDKDRMRSLFADGKYIFKGYRESRDALEKSDRGEELSEKDVNRMFRMFNYVLPNSGKDVDKQRDKFLNIMKEKGYEAILDTNDSIYGGFKAKSPIIVIDPESVVLKNVERTTMNEKRFSTLVGIGRKALGV